MQLARRSILPDPDHGQHPGLILTRYLKEAVQKGAEPSKEKSKENLFAAAKKACADKQLKAIYKLARKRWLDSLPLDSRRLSFTTESKIIIGLGGENVTETGLTLHHTYGVPYLPGSALKGVAARYARQVWGATDPSWRPETKERPNHFCTLFGTSDEGGLVDFLDGWIAQSSLEDCLIDDVMTPHHGDYYMAKEDQVREPTDFDSPIPVPFLAVKGHFLVAICKRDPRLTDPWIETAAELLAKGLAHFGIGGKTNAGYGRLTLNQPRATPGPIQAPVNVPPSGDDVELEIMEVATNGQLTVLTADASLAGPIANPDEVPRELRVAGKRLVGRVISGGDADNVQFYFIRAVT